jgi:hypothetical protein
MYLDLSELVGLAVCLLTFVAVRYDHKICHKPTITVSH